MSQSTPAYFGMTLDDKVVLDHGSGGVASRVLIETFILPRLSTIYGGELEDSAVLPSNTGDLAFTIDSFVVSPMIFGNGDIGKIAVCGTVNDLAASGAVPVWLALSFVIEEGFPLRDLDTILTSIRTAAEESEIKLVCGDTKVVEVGAIDKIVITASGLGKIPNGHLPLHSNRIEVNDAIIVTGNLGDHGLHILSCREGLGYDAVVPSDCAPLGKMMEMLTSAFPSGLHAARDLTRGGFSTICTELADSAHVRFEIEKEALPIRRETRMGCDMLGVDPLHLANEGCLILFVAEEIRKKVIQLLRGTEYGHRAAVVGRVTEGSPAVVALDGDGVWQPLRPLAGRVLPRLC